MDKRSTAQGAADLDLGMLGETELAAMEKLFSTEAEGDSEAVGQLKAALAKDRARSTVENPADALLGQALMSGGVSCADGIALFERGMGEGAKRFCVLAVLPGKPLSATALAKLAERIQEAIAPGRAVVVGDAVAVVWLAGGDGIPDGLVECVRAASVIAGAPCAVGVAEATSYFELLSVCFEHARYAAGKARNRGLDLLSYEECRFEYLADKVGLDDAFAYVRDARVLGLYESDCERGSDLLATAVTYIQCGFNLGHTAAEMHLHRNSVVYRLNRIAERSGIDLLGPYEDFDVLTLLLTCKLYRARLDESAVPEEWTPSC
ncbi:MAG: helix-turn-helix domain-containing protein [Eggerthellaceae bacterium]|nr:helix-turn-helix domain-containing protein [Eggerthellaceae bacterium]